MAHRFKYLSLIILFLLFCICGGCDKSSDTTGNETQSVPDDEKDDVGNSTFSNTVVISFGSSVSISNPLEGKGVSISTNGDQVTLSSTAEEVEYILTGSTSNGFVKIYSDYKFKLILDEVHITNPTGPAINIQSGKRVFVELSKGTQNTLTDGSLYTTVNEEDMKAAFFSEGQLLFSGTGSLHVNGNYKHGICSDDYIRIYEGNITINAAVSDGIHTNDAFVMDGGSLTVTAATEGIESKNEMIINGGNIHVEAYDDCINASTSIVINGGDIYCYSTANDGIDSNGTLTITGGNIVAIGTSSPEEGIDCDQNTFAITGGTILGIGGATSSPTANACTQHSVIYGGSGTVNMLFQIKSASGTEVLSYTIPRSLQQMTLLFSSPELETGSYTIYSNNAQLTTFSISSMVTTVGSTGGGPGGNPGGGPGGRW